jgi:hypothetical protein
MPGKLNPKFANLGINVGAMMPGGAPPPATVKQIRESKGIAAPEVCIVNMALLNLFCFFNI